MDRLHDRDPSEVGPYELLGVLGHGGMGRVFLGRDADGRLAAVKVVSEDLAGDTGFRKRFAREVAATRAVQDRYVAAILDADVEARRPWLATEYIDGPSLHEVVQDLGRMPAEQVRALAARLAEALAAIHAAGLAHRDVKPANILIAADGARLIDFGIARDAAVSTITRTGTVLGTPAYMAPERFQGKAGPRSPADVFSLGGVLAYALTGHHPFGEEEPGALAYRIVHEPAQVDDIEDADLRDLVSRCLEKDPERRPSAADIEKELRTGARAAGAPEQAVLGGPAGEGSGGAAGDVEPGESVETVVLRPGRWRRPALVGGASLAAVVILAAVLADGDGDADAGKGSGSFPGAAASKTSTGTSTSASSAIVAATTSSASASAPSSPAAKPDSPSSSQQHPASPPSASSGLAPATSSDASIASHPSTAPKSTPPHSSAAPPTSRPPASKPPAGSPPAQMAGFDVAESSCVGSCHVSITLTWSAQSDATGYEVHFVDSTAGVDQTDPTGGTSYVVHSTTDDSVCLSMAATNQYGASAWKGPYCFTA